MMNPQIEEQLKNVTSRIVEAFNPYRIVVFGSQVYGHPTSDSDIDLLIIMDSNERPATRATQVSKVLRPRPFPMDILVRTPEEIQYRLEIGDYFIREVMEQGKVLYERSVSERVGSQSQKLSAQ